MHIPEMESALSELSRVLKLGGILVLYENNMHSLDVVFREPAIRIVKRLLGRRLPEIRLTATRH
jgi:ubiquinone/menaquinone biosynthesis C-methylase UbiE